MKMILGKKVGMTRVYDKTGKIIPATLILAGPCYVVQIKTKEKDGYGAVQIGFDRKKKITKPERGHLDRLDKNLPNFKYLKELRIEKKEDLTKFKKKQEIKISDFQEGEKVKITGISKGRGFAGVMKRHGFHGQPKTHGHKHDLRKPGSIGSTDLQRVRKGLKMAGHMGQDQKTVLNLEIVKIDTENNLIALKGAVPGARNGLVMIKSV
jgi:large subunit ribosomal protein L3